MADPIFSAAPAPAATKKPKARADYQRLALCPICGGEVDLTNQGHVTAHHPSHIQGYVELDNGTKVGRIRVDKTVWCEGVGRVPEWPQGDDGKHRGRFAVDPEQVG